MTDILDEIDEALKNIFIMEIDDELLKETEGDIILNAIEKTGSNVGFSGWSRPDCGIRIGL